MKYLRLGDFAILPTFLHDWVHVISLGRLLRLQPHSGAAYAVWYLRGAVHSFRYHIDRKRRIYMPVQGSDSTK
jgi:hypothetical protein